MSDRRSRRAIRSSTAPARSIRRRVSWRTARSPFPVTITARQVLEVDPSAIEAEIRGKSLTEAKAILDRYGRSELSVWPDWVGTIPALDARVDVQTTEVAEP